MPHENQYVLGRGWITDWMDYEETKTRRIYRSNVVLKKADKNLTFDNQQAISKEEHLNVFLPYELFEEGSLERYSCVSIAGYITQYQRKNGTRDYGVSIVEQSSLHDKLDKTIDAAVKAVSNDLFTQETLITLNLIQQILKVLRVELESSGDLLPTFHKTYSQYREEINQMLEGVRMGIERIKSVCSNRSFRRKHKIKRNFAPKAMDVASQMQTILYS
jgi:hypothetical protein